jgi:translation initiation factor 5A
MSVTRKEAGQLKKGNYFLLEGEVHRVIAEPIHSKSGKHGHAKMRVESESLFTGKKASSTFPADTPIEVPNIEKKTGQVLSMGDTVSLMDQESFESFEALLPDDEELKAKVAPDAMVEYWIVMDKKVIMRVMS